MASLIPGFEYDIFISYRQKDNKGDRWVSEFVEALRTELESTFKEEIDVYFDINPHDGLLETHDVDASLKEKLKCLVFIPVISRTYCDPKSFAWEHEFKAFIEQASQDQFGLKVKLPNGNVANRVLPIRIHDLDDDDVKLFEQATGGIMRTIDFVFRTASGVNRPLKAKEDHPNDNINKTYYQDQINKTALALKEIMEGLKREKAIKVNEEARHIAPSREIYSKEKRAEKENPVKLSKYKLLSGIAILAILIIAAILFYPKIFKRDTLEELRSSGESISVAVMPFQNMTNDTTWNVWQKGIQEILTNSLSYSEELKVRQTESINSLIQDLDLNNYAAVTLSVARAISQKMTTNVFIYGNIIKADSLIRINAQLIDSKTEEVLKPFHIEEPFEKESIIHLIDLLSSEIKNTLIISNLEKTINKDYRNYAFTGSPEAFKDFIYGKDAFLKKDFPAAVKMLSQAVQKDSDFLGAYDLLAWAFGNQGMYDQAKEIALKLYKKRDQVSVYMKAVLSHTYATFFGTVYEDIKCLKQILEIDDQVPVFYYVLGSRYNNISQFDKAIPELEKSLEIYKKWGSKPGWSYNYSSLGYAYHKTGRYEKEKKLYKKAEQDFPDDPAIIYRQAILSLTEGDEVLANQYIEKLISVGKENSWSDARITTTFAGIYMDAGFPDKAEEYYRKALSLEPENPERLNNLAFFLIDKDRNTNEGLELIGRALQLNPDNYLFIYTKGCGLFKQGKCQEALVLLEKCDSLKPIYDHDLYLLIQEVKKVVENKK